MRRMLLIPAACLFIAGPGFAAELGAAEQQATEAAQDGSDTIRCRRIEVTGSLVRKTKICKTQAEWERIGRGENAEARRVLDMNLQGSSTNGD